MGKRIEKSEMPNATDSNHESYCLGCSAFDAGRFAEAKRFFREALDYWSEDYQAWWALGNCYDSLGKPEKAEDCYRKALEWSGGKSESELLFNLGNSLFDQQRYSEATKIYSKISAQSSLWSKVQRNLSLIEGDQE